MTRRPAVLLDMDGVVVDNMAAHAEAWRLFFLDHGIRIGLREFYEKTSGMPTRDVLSYYFARRVPPREAERLSTIKEELYRNIYRKKMRPANGLVSFLRACRSAGLRIGLGTGSKEDNVAFILDGLELRGYFDAIVQAGDVRKGKPDPETFITLSKRLGVPPRRCLVFEDSLLGELAARRAGMKVVAVTSSHAAGEFEGPALAVRDFRGLSAARALALLPTGRAA